MTYVARLLRGYGEADWLARLILTTCFAAALNFGDVFLLNMRLSRAAGTHVVDGYEITFCYLGPPAYFYYRLIVFGFLLVASLFAFNRELFNRVMCGAGLAGAFAYYIYWWIRSYVIFENTPIAFFGYVDGNQTAYLYDGSWLDVLVALAIIVCLTLVLDRLFDGEKPECING